MSSMTPLNLNVLLPSGHFESKDYFQQMLSIDSALEALSISKRNLTLKLRAMAAADGFKIPPNMHAFEWEEIESSLADLAQLLKTFEELQAAARHRFELRARSLRKGKTSIMDFPDEVLMMIFENFRAPLDFPIFPPNRGDNEDDTTTIKNIRLTCLRFRRNSSHLLVRCLNVSPDASSLKHMEKVLSHPEISRGERILEIDLKYYSAAIAADFQAFSTMCYKMLVRQFQFLEWRVQQQESTGMRCLPKGMSLESAKASTMGMQHILSLWGPFRNRVPSEESAQLNAAALALRRGHERYRALFQQQNGILQDNSFARTVAAAASKSKVWLSISDAEIIPWGDRSALDIEEFDELDFMLISDPSRLQHDLSPMVRPHQWWHFRGENTEGGVPRSLLYEIPLAMRMAEVKLAGLQVHINFPHDLNLKMSQEQLSGLTDVTKNLKTFKFCMRKFPGRGTDPPPSPEDMKTLYAYIHAVTGLRTVPTLLLDFTNSFGSPDGMWFPIGTLLRSLNLDGLKSAVLEHVLVNFRDLRYFVDMLQPGTRLGLKDIRLGSGTWAAALDCLRSKVSRDSWLVYPKGAECDLMTDEEYANVFHEFDGCSDATLYITSVEGVENPLRNNDEATEVSVEL